MIMIYLFLIVILTSQSQSYLQFQDSLTTKAPKKSPLSLRLLVLAFTVICGVYICSICLKQTAPHTTATLLNSKIFYQPCNISNAEPWELSYMHYPEPQTFSRYLDKFKFQVHLPGFLQTMTHRVSCMQRRMCLQSCKILCYIVHAEIWKWVV